ncbi:MAG: type II secretion system protein GspM [Thermodesulfobacteriota bacterium]
MQIGAREKKAIVIAAVAVVAYLIYAIVISPTRERQERVQEELAASSLLLKKYQTVTAGRDQIRGELKQGTTELAQFESRLLTADKPPLAASQLQQIINQMATKVAIDIRSITILRPNENGPYVEIAIRVVFAGNSPKLKALLEEIEGHRLLLQVKELAINVINPNIERNLQVTMVVSGFTKKGV